MAATHQPGLKQEVAGGLPVGVWTSTLTFVKKGMHGQLVAGRGNGNLWVVNGSSDDFIRPAYLPVIQPGGCLVLCWPELPWL